MPGNGVGICFFLYVHRVPARISYAAPYAKIAQQSFLLNDASWPGVSQPRVWSRHLRNSHPPMVENVPRSEAILQAMSTLEDGCLVAPKRPGLGLAPDEAAV